MTELMRPYSHPARLLQPGDRECRVCGRPVTAIGTPEQRHLGEVVRPLIPAREDLPAFEEALKIMEAALAAMPTDRVADADRARVCAQELYRQGGLRTGRSRWKRPRVPAQ